jgi:hypothetical protein
MKLFLYSMRIKNPVVLDSIALPCLRILQHVIRPAAPISQKYKVSDFQTLKGAPVWHLALFRIRPATV